MNKETYKAPLPGGLFLPNACNERGSDMGRRNQLPDNTDDPVKLRLQRMRIDSGGYDSGGAYWGSNINNCGDMYAAWGDGEEYVIKVFVRAHDRAEAKQMVNEILPRAHFFA